MNNYYYNGFNMGRTGCMFIILLYIICVAIVGFMFMLLWNWLMPLFWNNAPILNFWEACGVYILLSLIGSLFRDKSSK